jgi:predicted transposase/invertase (TIGR01784 family)
LQDRIFQKLFEQAEIARYSESERRQYEESKKVFWDNYSVLKTAERKGEVKGAQKEKIETIHRMKAKGFSIEDISESVGLTIEEVKKLM